MNCNPHFHSLVIDGVYAARKDGCPEFHVLPAPEDEEVVRVTTLVSQRVQSLLKRRGLGTETDSQLEIGRILHLRSDIRNRN